MTPCPQSYRWPAEWEPQSAVQLTWPHAGTDWRPYLEEITGTFVRLARTIMEHERLLVVAKDTKAVSQLIGTEDVTYFQCDTDDTWARDHAPLTLIGSDGAEIVDFKFNGWGEKFPWQKDNAITRKLYDAGLIRAKYIDANDMVLEGGSVETDGEGTLYTTEHCLLAPHRNQLMEKADIERELKKRLKVSRVVWLRHGLIEGDDTDGHIDTMVRTAPGGRLVYQGSDPDDPTQKSLREMEEELQGLGCPLTRLPAAPHLEFGGEMLPATYANFVVINSCVIVPTYGDEKADRAAMDAISGAFPGREVVGVDASVVVRQHGSLHCLTMQYPKGVII